MRTFLVATVFIALVAPAIASAHAFPDRSAPRVGATLTAAPTQVQVWFDGLLEPTFSTLIVRDAAGKQVSDGKGEVGPGNHSLLETSLPASLSPGTYTVYWSVIAHDGHHTAGHFAFTVK